ncbi:hypothetical protein CBR_g23495 [Chara braunii]|uniref:Reverse transcriptase RNase H-like domain-containing protein n=1 Tax=Chara braunii TaxID=69332 RepID=A0A388L4D1_CHABU|nr:hypothetical protein CBR_g23495 [Chara braunii]|eukprot:GBG77169.1 hypothetical protein CBR_g23495 [Chara braunii]
MDWVGVELVEDTVYLVMKLEWRARGEFGGVDLNRPERVHATGSLHLSEEGWRTFGIALASGDDPVRMFEGAWQVTWREGFEFADPEQDDVTAEVKIVAAGVFELPNEVVRMSLPPFLLRQVGGIERVEQAVTAVTRLNFDEALMYREYDWAFLEMGPFGDEQGREVLCILRAAVNARPGVPQISDETMRRVMRREVGRGATYINDLYRLYEQQEKATAPGELSRMTTEEGIDNHKNEGESDLKGSVAQSEGGQKDRESINPDDTKGNRKEISTGESSGKAGGRRQGTQGTKEGRNKDRTGPRNSEGVMPKKVRVTDTRRKLAEIDKRTAKYKARLIEEMMNGKEEGPLQEEPRDERKASQGGTAQGDKGSDRGGTSSKRRRERENSPGMEAEKATTPPTMDSRASRLPITPAVARGCEGLWSLRERVLGWFDPEGTMKTREGQKAGKECPDNSVAGEANSSEGDLKKIVSSLARALNKNQGYLTDAKKKLTFDGANITEFLIDYENLAALLKWTEEEKMDLLGQHVSLSLGRDIMAIVAASQSWKETLDVMMRKYLAAEKMATEADLAAVQRKNFATYNDFLREFTLVALRIPGVTDWIMSKYFLRQFFEFDKDKILLAYQQTSKFVNTRDVDFNTVIKGEIFGPQGERVNKSSLGGMRRAIIMLNGLEITAVEVELVGEIIWDQLRGRGPQAKFILESDGRDRVNATTRLGTAGRRINRDTIMEEVAGSSEPQAEPEAEKPKKVYGKPREEESADKVIAAKNKFRYQIPILTLPELDDNISKLLGTMMSVSFQTMLQASPRLLKGLRQLLTRRRVEIGDNPELPEGEREEEAPQEVANLQRSHGDFENLEKAFADIRLSLPDREGGEVMRSPLGTKHSFHALPVGKLKIQIGSHHTDTLVDGEAEITLIRRDFTMITGCTVGMHLHDGSYMVDIEDPVTGRGELLRLLGTRGDPPRAKLATWSPSFEDSTRKGAFARMEGMRERVEIMIEEAFNKKKWIKMGLPKKKRRQEDEVPDPAMTDKISQWPTPLRTTMEVRAFLGVVGFWRIFIKNFAKIVEPIRAIIREEGTMNWTEEREGVVQRLKDILISETVALSAPCFNDEVGRPFILETDEGPLAVGGVLIQRDEGGQEKPIRFESRSLNSAEQRYSQFKKEVLDILHCLKTFQAYLFGRRFILRIDPTNVAGALKNYRPIDPMVERWVGFIWQFDYKIERIAGIRSKADGLSRVCITPEGMENADLGLARHKKIEP